MDVKNQEIEGDNEPSWDELPLDILEEIFLRIDPRILLPFALVCSNWYNIIHSVNFWKRRTAYIGIHLPREVLQNDNLPWNFYHSLCLNYKFVPYQKNLLVNGSGELENNEDIFNDGNRNEEDFNEAWFASWNTLSSGGNGWRLFKSIPPNTIPKEVGQVTYFATSNYSCTKEQWVSLADNGVDSKTVDTFQPDINIEEFYSKSRDHGATYEMQVCLLDGCGNVVGKSFSFRDDMEEEDTDSWRKVSHTFKDYGVGVRYVKFYHGGMASGMELEDGWFGSRMTGASVSIRFPEKKKTDKTFSCNCNIHLNMRLTRPSGAIVKYI